MNPALIVAVSLSILCATGCSKSASTLSVHTDYLSHENLASYYVNTPDPRLNNPSIGQRLILSWSVPKKLLKLENLHLELTLRFRNREESLKIIPISKTSGTYVYALMNDDYRMTQGILTYKINLKAEHELIESWLHQIWTELVTIEHTASTLQNEEINRDFEEEI